MHNFENILQQKPNYANFEIRIKSFSILELYVLKKTASKTDF